MRYFQESNRSDVGRSPARVQKPQLSIVFAPKINKTSFLPLWDGVSSKSFATGRTQCRFEYCHQSIPVLSTFHSQMLHWVVLWGIAKLWIANLCSDSRQARLLFVWFFWWALFNDQSPILTSNEHSSSVKLLLYDFTMIISFWITPNLTDWRSAQFGRRIPTWATGHTHTASRNIMLVLVWPWPLKKAANWSDGARIKLNQCRHVSLYITLGVTNPHWSLSCRFRRKWGWFLLLAAAESNDPRGFHFAKMRDHSISVRSI